MQSKLNQASGKIRTLEDKCRVADHEQKQTIDQITNLYQQVAILQTNLKSSSFTETDKRGPNRANTHTNPNEENCIESSFSSPLCASSNTSHQSKTSNVVLSAARHVVQNIKEHLKTEQSKEVKSAIVSDNRNKQEMNVKELSQQSKTSELKQALPSVHDHGGTKKLQDMSQSPMFPVIDPNYPSNQESITWEVSPKLANMASKYGVGSRTKVVMLVVMVLLLLTILVMALYFIVKRRKRRLLVVTASPPFGATLDDTLVERLALHSRVLSGLSSLHAFNDEF